MKRARTSVTYPLIADAALYNTGATLTNVVLSGTVQSGSAVQWLVSDHLGTPRMVVDQTGSLDKIKRHDYLPFGEELIAGQGGRVPAQGYAGDNVRQQFTGYERDDETGLDYAQARYFSSTQGRFTSIDPTLLSVKSTFPQTWNRYVYVTNNPLCLVDPLGLWALRRAYIQDADGNRTRVYIFVKTKDDDDAASLVKQMGFDSKDKGVGEALANSISASLGKNSAIRISSIDVGGKVGNFLSKVESKLVAQDAYDSKHQDKGNKTTRGPDDRESFDCSSTTCRLSFPDQMASLGEKTSEQNFGVSHADQMISELTTPVKSENDLRTRDIVRYGKGADRHFGNFVYRDDNGVPQIFSRLGKGNSFEVHGIGASSVTSRNNRGGVNGMFRPR